MKKIDSSKTIDIYSTIQIYEKCASTSCVHQMMKNHSDSNINEKVETIYTYSLNTAGMKA